MSNPVTILLYTAHKSTYGQTVPTPKASCGCTPIFKNNEVYDPYLVLVSLLLAKHKASKEGMTLVLSILHALIAEK